MKRFLLFIIFIAAATGCRKNSITGRSQLNLIPESTLQEYAVSEYNLFLSQNRVVSASTSKDAEMVKRVGSRIAASISLFLAEKGQKEMLRGFKWEFNLVDNNQVNAWCMPGGKVVVYTGLLPVSQNEAALAVVLGHEITHAVGRHGNERISRLLLAKSAQAAGNLLTQNSSQASSVFNNVYGPAAALGVMLPNSRNQEYEADRYGLIFAALAGYNPREAVGFWQRMDAASNQKPAEFLSSHPSNKNRIKMIEKHMEEALSYYRPPSGE
jgi:predicted Zn-dependent protease